MKFERWLIKQQHRNDPIGDLAMDYIRDGKPEHLTINYLRGKSACEGAIIAFKRALKEFEKIKGCYLCDKKSKSNTNGQKKEKSTKLSISEH